MSTVWINDKFRISMLVDLSMDEINKILKEYNIDSNKFELYVNYIIDSYKMNLKHTIESTLTTFKYYKKYEWKHPIGSIVKIKEAYWKKFETEWKPKDQEGKPIQVSDSFVGIIRHQYEDYEDKYVEIFFSNGFFDYYAEKVPTEFLVFEFENNIIPVGTLVYVWIEGKWVLSRIQTSDVAPLYRVEIVDNQNIPKSKWVELRLMIIPPYEALGEGVHRVCISDMRRGIFYPHLLIYKNIALPENLTFSFYNSDKIFLMTLALEELMGAEKFYKKNKKPFDSDYLEKMFYKYCNKHNLIVKWQTVSWEENILTYHDNGCIKTPSTDQYEKEIKESLKKYD